MTPIKQTVYLPKDGSKTVLKPIDLPVEKTIRQEGYFFTPEQLNEYTANVVRQALETAAEEVTTGYDSAYNVTVEKDSITNTFEETCKKFKV